MTILCRPYLNAHFTSWLRKRLYVKFEPYFDQFLISDFCFQLIVANGATPLVDILAYTLADEGGLYVQNCIILNDNSTDHEIASLLIEWFFEISIPAALLFKLLIIIIILVLLCSLFIHNRGFVDPVSFLWIIFIGPSNKVKSGAFSS